MKNILEKNNLLKPAKIGDIVEGKIIRKEGGAVYVDLGNQGTGIIYGKELLEAKDIIKDLKIGDSIFTKIVDLENEEGYLELSIRKAGQEIAWESLRQKKEKGEIIKVKILGANKGGLLTEISGLSAFLPVSQLSFEHYPRLNSGDAQKILKELQKFIGQELEVKIFDIDSKTQKLILSEKIQEINKIKEILKNYKVGDIVEGEVTGIVDFGAFFKFLPQVQSKEKTGEETKENQVPIEGLIHISELDWSIVEDPSEIVKVGQRVKAKIIDIQDDRVSLSLKALKKDPWKNIEKKYKKGDIIEGKVIKFNPFGAFVQVKPKIQGLCHISEFGTRSKMEEKLKIGEKYNFQILEIRPEEHRLTLKLIEDNPQ